MKKKFSLCYMYFDGDIWQPYRRKLVEVSTDIALKDETKNIIATLENIKTKGKGKGNWQDYLDECIEEVQEFLAGLNIEVWVGWGSKEFGLKLVEIEVVENANGIELIEFEGM